MTYTDTMGFNLVAFVKAWVLQICTFFLSFLLCPFVLPLILLIHVFRLLVLLSSKVFRPDLRGILGVRSTVYGHELVDTTTSAGTNLVATIIMKGQYTRSDALNHLTKLITMKRHDGGQKYPELSKYVVPWLGFLFWKKDPTFSVDKYVNYIYKDPSSAGLVKTEVQSDKVVTTSEEDLIDIEREVVRSQFGQMMSPWEFLIVPNYTGESEMMEEGDGGKLRNVEHTVLMFKIHHGLADGYSIRRLLVVDLLGVPEDDLVLPTLAEPGILWTFLLYTYLLLMTPYFMLSVFFLKPDDNALHQRNLRPHGNSKYYAGKSKRISLEDVKSIKASHGVSFLSVILSAVGGGMRKTIAKRGGKESLPPFLHTILPLPIPGNPDRLCNHMSLALFPMPLACKDFSDRVKLIQRTLDTYAHSLEPIVTFFMQGLLGGLFYWLAGRFSPYSVSTAVTSDFPGPRSPIAFRVESEGEVEVVDICFSSGFPPPSQAGLMIFGFSYAGKWKLVVQGDGAYFKSDGEVQGLVDDICNEIYASALLP